ncbi:MAG: thiolase family protein [Clostridiales Family XIII bacterium]|jgi:acetyl-CoA C-acetyltransferase|nr:thiolase family protein [Clostridiales Family XIII bacterium]
MKNVYLLGGLRSHIGVKNKMFKNIAAEDLGAAVLSAVCEKFSVGHPDWVVGGNAVGSGGNITRLAMLKAGLPDSVPAFTVDSQCGSGLQAILTAVSAIAAGQADAVLAGGMESSSTQPLRQYPANHPLHDPENPCYTVAAFSPETNSETAMLEGAERVAEQEHMHRDELDACCLRSHERAKQAKEQQLLSDMILSVAGSVRDEGIRETMRPELLAKARPILNGGTHITSANACGMHDGAAFVVLCSESYAHRQGLSPCAEIIGSSFVGGTPGESPRMAVESLERLCGACGIAAESLDAIELNEAFAVISVLFQRKYPQKVPQYNRLGGALAYGHPYGASGGVLLLHLLRSLQLCRGTYGACGIAAAGGLGTALLVRRLPS